LRIKVQRLFHDHRYLLDSDRLSPWEIQSCRAILDGTADAARFEEALLDLSGYLHAHHGERVVVLVDEYDEPIHAGYFHGFAPKILELMRRFLGAGLKSNVHLFKAVLTGILRVAKENLFSGLNNLDVFSLLKRPFNTCFGFTEAEVTALLARAGEIGRIDQVRTWYDGYRFGGEVVYNPWSVLCFLRDGGEPEPYWLSTSSNDLVRELLERYALRLQPVFETLLEGGSVERVLDENVVLTEVGEDEGALWSLLVFSGYLKAEKGPVDALGRVAHRLSIPNREVREVYATTFRR
jgi:hypothetical protein